MDRHASPTLRAIRADDGAIARIGEVQHGAISRTQLLDLGLCSTTIGRRLEDGRLHRRHNGVYAVGHPRLSDEGRLWAACLAAPNTGLDGLTGAWALGVLDPHPDPLFVVGPTKRRRTRRLRPRVADPMPELVLVRGLRVAALEALLEQLPENRRQRAEANAAYLGLMRRRRYATETRLERKFLRLVRLAGLPVPETQVEILGKRRDFVFLDRRLIVETDEPRGHDTTAAFEADRRRDAEALARGWRTVRFTEQQILEDPGYVLATLRALLTGTYCPPPGQYVP